MTPSKGPARRTSSCWRRDGRSGGGHPSGIGELAVTVVDKAVIGRKMRQSMLATKVDSGPTVLTMRWAFDDLFEAAGARLDDHVTLDQAEILARHGWTDGSSLDLFADVERSVEAVAAFSSPAEGDRFRAFCERTREVYRLVEQPFIRSSKPTPFSLIQSQGLFGMADFLKIEPFATLWSSLGRQFSDPRLRQLFGRYATYCGSSPFEAPATLMLVAHVEQEGVWTVRGGMHELAQALKGLAERLGVSFRLGSAVAEIETDRSHVSGVMLANGERMPAGSIVMGDVSCKRKAGQTPSRQDACDGAGPPVIVSLHPVDGRCKQGFSVDPAQRLLFRRL